ncbi:MAG: metallophosphoesterase [Bifidobacteriaceae bacterium]|nr:metallophosphoesterase [Bifidobacteriaceae bacterium]
MLASTADPFTVLHLSDLHMTADRRGRRRAAWIRRLAAEAPDLVVLTGDNLAHSSGLPVLLDALAPVLAGPGAFVFGSNDYVSAHWHNPARYLTSRLAGRREPETGQPLPEDQFDLPWAELRAALVQSGWFDLNNARARTVIGGHDIRLVGLDDPHIARDAMPGPAGADVRTGLTTSDSPLARSPKGSRDGDVSGGKEGTHHGHVAAKAAGSSNGDVSGGEDGGPTIVLGVVHAPYRHALRSLADDGAHLILAGHTHGGQIALPGHGALIANCDVGTDRARGLHGWPGPRPDEPGGENSVWLHISAGLGTSPYVPLRIAARPEATLLTLTASNTDRDRSSMLGGL